MFVIPSEARNLAQLMGQACILVYCKLRGRGPSPATASG